MKVVRKRNSMILPAALMLCALGFYLYIGFCVPYCHDDWDWGLDIGLQNWLHASLNSRYSGSFFAVAMTRSEIFKTIVMGLSMFLCPLMMAEISGHREKTAAFVLANVLLLVMPRAMWQQTYGWVSGFANYVVPVPPLLFLITVMERSAEGMERRYWYCVPPAAALCLFMENLTVYMLPVCVLFTAVCAVRYRRVEPFHTAMCAALALGSAIMFSSSIYGNLLNRGLALEGIRNLTVEPGSGAGEYITVWGKRFFKELLPELFYGAPTAPACASLALIAGVLNRNTSWSAIFISLLTGALNVYICLGYKSGVLEWAAPLALFLCLLVLAVMSREKLVKKLFFLLSAPAVILPLVVTGEAGPRLFFLPYVFLMSLTVISLPEAGNRKLSGAVLFASAIALAACFAFYINIFSQIRAVTVSRAEAIASAVENGDAKLILEDDLNKYWWGRNPASEERMVYFKEFYGIPQNMEVIIGNK